MKIIVNKKEATELLKELKEITIIMLSSKGNIITDTRIAKQKEPISECKELNILIRHNNRAKNIKPILSKGFTLSLENGEWSIDKDLIVEKRDKEGFFTDEFKVQKRNSLRLSKEDFEELKRIYKKPLPFQEKITFVPDEEGVRVYAYDDINEFEAWETILESSEMSQDTRVSIRLQYLVELLDCEEDKIIYYDYDKETEEIISPINTKNNGYAMPVSGLKYKERLESNWTPRTEQEEAEWQERLIEMEQQRKDIAMYYQEKNFIERFYKEKSKLDSEISRCLNSNDTDSIKESVGEFLRKYQHRYETERLTDFASYYKYLELDESKSVSDNLNLIEYLERLESKSHFTTLDKIASKIDSAKTTTTKLELDSFGISGTIKGTIIDLDLYPERKQRVLGAELVYEEFGKQKHIIADANKLIEIDDFIEKEILYCEEHSHLLECVAELLISQSGTDRMLHLEYSDDILTTLTEDYNEGECDLDKLIDKEHNNLHLDYGYADLRVYSLTDQDINSIDFDLLYSYQNEFEQEINNLLYDESIVGKYKGKIGIYSRKQKDIFVYEKWEKTTENKDIDKIIARHYVPKEILQKVADKIKEIATMYVEYSIQQDEEQKY